MTTKNENLKTLITDNINDIASGVRKDSNARLNLVSRRWAPFFWIIVLWNAWFFFIKDVNIWNWVVFGALLIITLILPVLFLISSATYTANMEKITPEFKRPDGH